MGQGQDSNSNSEPEKKSSSEQNPMLLVKTATQPTMLEFSQDQSKKKDNGDNK